MTSPTVETVDLLDLKLLPAWVKEAAEPRSYAGTEGNHHRERPARHGRGTPTRSGKRSMLDVQRRTTKPSKHEVGRDRRARRGRDRKDDRPSGDKHAPITRIPLQFAIRFLPYSPAFENVVAQIKSGSVIRYLRWRVCSWKSRLVTRFASRQRVNRCFISLATAARCL